MDTHKRRVKGVTMKIPLLLIKFPGVDPEIAWDEMASIFGMQGYFVTQESAGFAIILGVEKIVEKLLSRSSLAKALNITALNNVSFSHLPQLKRIQSKSRDGGKQLFLDKAKPNGYIVGWFRNPHQITSTLQVSIDGRNVLSAQANVLREDLLRAGVGFGTHGFSFKCPSIYADGMNHRIDFLEVNAKAGASSELHHTQHDLVIPLRLPDETGDVSPLKSAERHYPSVSALEKIRSEVIYGKEVAGMRKAAKMISEAPEAVFYDFGTRERALIEGRFNLTFFHKLNHRWGCHFGRSVCPLGSECCKYLDLSYNPPTLRGRSTEKFWPDDRNFAACPMKLRHFESKSFTTQYAQKAGIPVPKVYARFSSIEEFDALDLPERYVLKPDTGSAMGIFLMHGNLNLVDGRFYSKAKIRKTLCELLKQRLRSSFAVEELISQEGIPEDAPLLPLDYKVHCFGGKGLIVQVIDRNKVIRGFQPPRQSWFSRNRVAAPFPMRFSSAPGREILPLSLSQGFPACWDDLLDLADKVSEDLQDYARVDCYASAEGPLLGEVSTMPNGGREFTEFGDTILSQAWELFSRSGESAI